MEGIMLLIIVILGVIIISIRQVDQYERGIKFMFGKFHSTMEPGWRIVLPVIQGYQKVDIRTRAVDVPDQEAITKDNISVRVNAVVYYRVVNSQKAILEVENFFFAISQLAQTTMRNIVGEVELDELLSNRNVVAERIRSIIDNVSDAWGIQIEAVELKDAILPDGMRRTIAKQAEAEREKRAVIIKAEGEVLAAENMAKAAEMLSNTTGALHLRTLQTLNDLSSDQSNTVVFATPIEVLRAVESVTQSLGQKIQK